MNDRGAAPALLLPMTMLPRRSRMSGREVVSASTAIISDDTVMSKPVALYPPPSSTSPQRKTSSEQAPS